MTVRSPGTTGQICTQDPRVACRLCAALGREFRWEFRGCALIVKRVSPAVPKPRVRAGADAQPLQGHMTGARVDDVLPWVGQPYSIKRHGVTIQNCDSEPVQTPGCIQARGALLVVRQVDLQVVQVSENLERCLGVSVDAALGQPLARVVGDALHGLVAGLVVQRAATSAPSYLATLPARATLPALDASAHIADGMLVLELEPTDVRVEAARPDAFELVRRAVAALQTSRTVRELATIACDQVRAITGLDRVMMYRFHPDHHGEVVAESKRADLAPWLGLHYPAQDIPKPARDIFRQIWIRPVPEIPGELAELVPLVNPETGRALTMTHCLLRGASVMYTEYLQNMGVSASLTLSVRRDDELWGLVTGHHYTGPAALPWSVRAACELVAQVVSLQLVAAERREELEDRLRIERVHQELIRTAAAEGEVASMVIGRPNLLDGMDAGGAALFHRGRWWTIGSTPGTEQLDALAAWLAALPEIQERQIYATDALSAAYPAGAAFAAVGSGLIAAPLARASGGWLLWFRPETVREIPWGGDPSDKPVVVGPHGPRLTPRRSFELFVESVRERARPWRRAELEAAAMLRTLLLELIVTQVDRVVALNADLSRSNDELDAFAYVASHDLKEPLRGIYKYAHQLADELASAPPELRKKLEGLSRLTVRMDDLLESLLHFSRVGRAALAMEHIDLGDVVAEALDMVASRRDQLRIVLRRPLPVVRCDRVRVRDVLMNLLSNALKYTDKAQPRIEVGYVAPDEDMPRGAAPPEATGQLVFFVRDDGIGIAAKHHDQAFRLFRRLHGRDDFGGGTGAGLTIVKRLVERHDGRIWIDSELGKGATFYFTLGGTGS